MTTILRLIFAGSPRLMASRQRVGLKILIVHFVMEYVVQAPENWKIGINVNIKQESEIAEPVVLLELPLENGSTKVIELSVKQFHLLRQQTAVALSKVISIREKLNPLIPACTLLLVNDLILQSYLSPENR